MTQRSLMLNLVQLIRVLFGAIEEILSLYGFWVLIRWLCVEASFDFISATMGLFIGIMVYWVSSLKRHIQFKHFGSFLSIMMQVFAYLICGNILYQSIIDIGDETKSFQITLIWLFIIIFVIFIISKLVDFVVSKFLLKMFENYPDDFEMIQASTYYFIDGNESYESYRYKLKTMNIFGLQLMHNEEVVEKN